MNQSGNPVLIFAFVVVVLLFLLLGGGMATGTMMSGGMMGGGMMGGGMMGGVSWIWLPTLLTLGLGILAWLGHLRKKVMCIRPAEGTLGWTQTKAMSTTVFVIEDDSQIRRVVEGYLQQAGYRVLSAADGLTGLL